MKNIFIVIIFLLPLYGNAQTGEPLLDSNEPKTVAEAPVSKSHLRRFEFSFYAGAACYGLPSQRYFDNPTTRLAGAYGPSTKLNFTATVYINRHIDVGISLAENNLTYHVAYWPGGIVYFARPLANFGVVSHYYFCAGHFLPFVGIELSYLKAYLPNDIPTFPANPIISNGYTAGIHFGIKYRIDSHVAITLTEQICYNNISGNDLPATNSTLVGLSLRL